MRFLLPVCVWLAAAVAAFTQPVGPVISAQSYSGQFAVREMRGRPRWATSPQAVRVPMAGGLAFMITAPPPSSAQPTDKVLLEPALLVVSCERVKEMFLLELGMNDDWTGKIDIIIDRAMNEDQPPDLTAIHSPNGWNYEMVLPREIAPGALVRALVEVLSAEVINRHSGEHPADIPYWLVEGLSAHLQAFNLPTFILRPNAQTAGYQKLTIEGMEGVRAALRGRRPLTFQQLSWPDQSDAAGPNAELYRACAQLLYDSLLHLKEGPAGMRRLFEELPKHLNWQTAFLQAFHSHFTRLLDVEKWWAVNCVTFTEANQSAPQTAMECWRRLQEALDVPVQVQMAPAQKSAQARLTLQEVIQEWDASSAQMALQRSIGQLEALQWLTYRYDLAVDASTSATANEAAALRAGMARELSPLVLRYVGVLANYLKESQPEAAGSDEGKSRRPGMVLLRKETVRDLNALDQERESIRARLSSASGGDELSALNKKAKQAQ